jgi:aryl carrier-like protein
VLAWGNTGIPLEFGHLAEHATLGGWWSVVQRLQNRGAAGA